MAAAVIAHRRGWRGLVFMRNQVREMSELVQQNVNGRKTILVDTLGMVRRLEGQGVPSKHSEAITSAITEALNDSMEIVSQSFVSNGKMRMSEIIQDANLSKFKSEVQISQGHHFSSLQRETEKLRVDIEKMQNEFKVNIEKTQSEHLVNIEKIQSAYKVDIEKIQSALKVDIEKIQSELKYGIDKLTAGQRLDLSLERGRSRDELAKQGAETSEHTNKLEREIHALKSHLEATKYEVIKYCIGTLVSLSAISLAVIRILI